LRRHRLSFVLVALAVLLSAGPAGFALTPAAPDSWQEQVRERIAAQEYELSWQDHPVLEELGSAWQALNRAHGFRSYFGHPHRSRRSPGAVMVQ